MHYPIEIRRKSHRSMKFLCAIPAISAGSSVKPKSKPAVIFHAILLSLEMEASPGISKYSLPSDPIFIYSKSFLGRYVCQIARHALGYKRKQAIKANSAPSSNSKSYAPFPFVCLSDHLMSIHENSLSPYSYTYSDISYLMPSPSLAALTPHPLYVSVIDGAMRSKKQMISGTPLSSLPF